MKKTLIFCVFLLSTVACASQKDFLRKEVNAVDSYDTYSFLVAQNDRYQTHAKFIALPPDTFKFKKSDCVGFEGNEVTLAQGEMFYIPDFGKNLCLSPRGFGFYRFEEKPCEHRCGTYSEAASRVEIYFNDGLSITAFYVPAIRPFALTRVDIGKVYGAENHFEKNKSTHIVLWGKPQRVVVEVFDSKNILLHGFIITEDDFIDGVLTHKRIPFSFDGVAHLEFHKDSSDSTPLWGIAVSGISNGTTQDVMPIQRY